MNTKIIKCGSPIAVVGYLCVCVATIVNVCLIYNADLVSDVVIE